MQTSFYREWYLFHHQFY